MSVSDLKLSRWSLKRGAEKRVDEVEKAVHNLASLLQRKTQRRAKQVVKQVQ